MPQIPELQELSGEPNADILGAATDNRASFKSQGEKE